MQIYLEGVLSSSFSPKERARTIPLRISLSYFSIYLNALYLYSL
ncbi:hypothetical protein CpecA_0625 [Chlamydia pecorum IPTaLE]|nr:hypothetical protein CpecA_0625 [Chlamydia pecorum IPTaLE]